LRNDSGQLYEWQMNGATVIADQSLDAFPQQCQVINDQHHELIV